MERGDGVGFLSILMLMMDGWRGGVIHRYTKLLIFMRYGMMGGGGIAEPPPDVLRRRRHTQCVGYEV